MNENKHLDERHEDRRLNNEDDEQLRGNTMNEAIREVHGDPDMDISALNDEVPQGGLGRNREGELYGADTTQGVGHDLNDASAVRSGGTVNMDDQSSGGAGLVGERRGTTNITTKRGVTGSDFDGQTATS